MDRVIEMYVEAAQCHRLASLFLAGSIGASATAVPHLLIGTAESALISLWLGLSLYTTAEYCAWRGRRRAREAEKTMNNGVLTM